jgi:hypothetical protein
MMTDDSIRQELLAEIEKKVAEALKGKNDHEVRRSIQSFYRWINVKLKELAQ